MNRTFHKILTLNLLHDYYTSGHTSDFAIMPTTATKRLLKSQRWVFKNTTQGFFIGCDNIAMGMLPAVLAQKTITLSFTLRLNNPHFMNFTELPVRSGSKDIYYLYSQQGSEILEMDTVALYPPVFTWSFTAVSGSNELKLEDTEANVYVSETFEGSDGQQLNASVNMKGAIPGLYRITVNDQLYENVYITDENPGNGIFGLVEISLPADFNPKTLGVYQFQFNARSSVWEYHLLFSKDYSNTGNYTYSFSIDHNLPEGGGYSFTEQQDPASDYTLGGHSVFLSSVPIPYREAARKWLQLTITHTDTNTENSTDNIRNHLPNPSVGNPESKVYLTI